MHCRGPAGRAHKRKHRAMRHPSRRRKTAFLQVRAARGAEASRTGGRRTAGPGRQTPRPDPGGRRPGNHWGCSPTVESDSGRYTPSWPTMVRGARQGQPHNRRPSSTTGKQLGRRRGPGRGGRTIEADSAGGGAASAADETAHWHGQGSSSRVSKTWGSRRAQGWWPRCPRTWAKAAKAAAAAAAATAAAASETSHW